MQLMTIPGCLLMFVNCIMIRLQGASINVGLTEHYLVQLHSTTAILGILYGVWSFVYIVSCAAFSKVLNKFPQWNYQWMIAGWITLSAATLTLCPSPLLDFIFNKKKYFWLSSTDMVVVNAVNSLLYLPPFPAALDLAEVHGHERKSLHTYGMITGLLNSGWGLGSTVGPVISGAVIDAQSFGWMLTYLGFCDLILGIVNAAYFLYMIGSKKHFRIPEASSAYLSSKKKSPSQVKVMKHLVEPVKQTLIVKPLTMSKKMTVIHLQQPERSCIK
ncbi:uncharacterized protein [Watersipora subatra]|uniref:uncharacterized protein n=1 Tax=Watersipora subatra TaxID=2589382 RepID=UPI00355C5BE2